MAVADVARPGTKHVSAPFAALLDQLTAQRGVRASLIVSEEDGLVVDANLRVGEDGDRVAALVASVYRKARRSSRAARLGGVSFLQLEADRGRICAAGRGDLVVVVVADGGANVGLMRMQLLKAVESLT